MSAMTYDKAINIIAENVYDLKKKSRYNSVQRRNQVVDFYGYEFSRDSDENGNVEIGLSISQDCTFYERFEFQLSISNRKTNFLSNNESDVFRDIPSNFKIYIEDIDLTPYFKAQFNGNWINGNGVYPNDGTAHYDVLLACGYLSETERKKILGSGYKRLRIKSDSPYHVDLLNYLKYSNTNR